MDRYTGIDPSIAKLARSQKWFSVLPKVIDEELCRRRQEALGGEVVSGASERRPYETQERRKAGLEPEPKTPEKEPWDAAFCPAPPPTTPGARRLQSFRPRCHEPRAPRLFCHASLCGERIHVPLSFYKVLRGTAATGRLNTKACGLVAPSSSRRHVQGM